MVGRLRCFSCPPRADVRGLESRRSRLREAPPRRQSQRERMGLCSQLLALSNQEVNRLNEKRGVSSSSAYAS